MKKIISMLVIIACLLPNVIIAEAAESLVALATFSSANATGTNITASIGSYSTTPTVNNAHGRNAWTIGEKTVVNGATTYLNQDIKLNINDSVKTTGRDNYRMEITYYDYENTSGDDGRGNPEERYRGRFFVKYQSVEQGAVITEPIIAQGTNTWKTVSVDIIGGVVGRVAEDFVITTMPSNVWECSQTPMYISEVKLYKLGTSRNATVTFNTVGNDLIFFAGDTQQISYTIKAHVDSTVAKYTQTLSVVDEDGNTLWTAAGTSFTQQNGGLKACTANLNITKYGIHKFVVETADNQGGYTKDSIEFAVMKKHAKPKLNDKFGISAHFSNNFNSTASSSTYVSETLPLYTQMGNGIIRDEIRWEEYEVDGQYSMSNISNTQWIDELSSKGVEILMLLGMGHTDHTGGDSVFPTTDAARTAFGNYVYSVVDALEGKVEYFEIYNEPNIAGGIPDEDARYQRGRDYAKLLKVAYARAKEANPNCKIVAFVTAGLSGNFLQGVLDEEPDIANYFDVMSFHQYAQGSRAETMMDVHGIYWIKDRLREVDADAPIWITETGVSSFSYGVSERESASWNVRHYLVNQEEKIYEKMFHYTWFDHHDTNYKWDSNLGILKRDFSPKRELIAYSAMNEFLADATYQARTIDAEDNYIYQFSGENKEIKVLYNEFDQKKSVTVTPKYQYNKLYDMYGNEIAMSGNTIKLDGEPCYFVSSTEPIVSDGASMVYETNEAVIKGSIDGAIAGEQMMIFALNPGYTSEQILVNPNALAYLEQVTIGEDGSYQFSFPMNGGAGEYNLYIAYKGSNDLIGPTVLDVSRDVVATTALYAGTTKITTLSQLSSINDAQLTVKGNIDNSHNVKLNAMLYAAGYKAGKLLWADMISDTPDIVGDNEMSFNINKSDAAAADEIKILLWKDNNSPLVNDVTPIN